MRTVRRPEDVGTPDSEQKGRNHPLYFAGVLRLSMINLKLVGSRLLTGALRIRKSTIPAGA